MSGHTIRARSMRPVPLHMWSILPESAGCYCIWSPSGEALYVGRGRDIRARLRTRAASGWWLTGYSKADISYNKHRLEQAPAGCMLTAWSVGSVSTSKQLELLLIGLLDPRHNRSPNAGSPCVLRVLQGGTS